MVPNVSLAGIIKEILDMLRIIPKENSISEISSGSGIHDGSQDTENILNVCVHGYETVNKFYFLFVNLVFYFDLYYNILFMMDSCHIDN